MEAILADEARSPDESDEYHRLLYLYRRFFGSQMELSSAVQRLLNDSHFANLLDRQSKSIKDKFKEMAEVIGRAHTVLKDVRNDICGHVLETAVQEALEGMNRDSFGFLDIGPTTKLTRYQFAGELVAAMLLKDCLALYANDRGLISFWHLK